MEHNREQQRPPVRADERRRLLSLLLLAGLSIQPLLWGCLPRADALFHLHRLAELARMVAQGHLFPRWLPDLGFGYGFPLFNYYAPLSYYLAMPWLILGTKAALLLNMALAALLLSLSLYLLGRDLFGVRAGLLAALLGAYAPYTLYDLYQRGAMAEMWGLAFLLLTLWTVGRAARHGSPRAYAAVALSYAALMLSHNITALIGTPILLGYALFGSGDHPGSRRRLHLLAALALGLGLSAFFWLPALAEKGYVQIQNLYAQPRFDFHRHFLTLGEMLAPPHPVDPARVNPPVPITLSWPALLLALAAWLPWGDPPAQGTRRTRGLLTVLFLAAVGMVTPWSVPVWERLPLLHFLQFPWRFLGEASLALALLGGMGGARLLAAVERRAFLRRWGLPLLYLLLTLYALPWLFPDCQRVEDDFSPTTLIRTEMETGGIGTTAAADYLPRWVERMPDAEPLLQRYALHPQGAIPRLDESALPDTVHLVEARWEPLRATLRLTATRPTRLVLDWFYFPGWQVWCDGAPLEVAPWGEEGLLSFTVPAGEHRLVVLFGETPLRHVADLLSAVAFGLLLVLLITEEEGSARPRVRPLPPPSLPAALHRTLLVAALLLGCKVLILERTTTPFALHRFREGSVEGVSRPLDMIFGGQMRLVGLDLPDRPLDPERDLPIVLYWSSIPPVAADYSVGLYLLDSQGHLYGQRDHQNPGGYPTRRLDRWHYIQDEYSFRPFTGTPPGRYRLEVALYDPRSDEQLEVRDSEGRFLGRRVPIAEVEVERAEHFPPVESLPRPAPLSLPLGDGIRFLGGDALPTAMREGEQRTLVLYWQAERAPQEATRAVLLWLDEAGEPIAAQFWVPGGEDHPPTTWAAGELVRDVVDVVAPVMVQAGGDPFAAGQFTMTLQLRLEGAAGPLGEGAPWGEVRLERPPRTSELPPLDAACEGSWSSLARLRGYRLEPPAPKAGEPFTLTLYWEALGTGDRPYTVFVHLLRDGKIVAQDDAPPARGGRPTTSWLRGEVIADAHPLLIPEEAGGGCYLLSLGFYDSQTLERLPLREGEDALTCPRPIHIAAP